MKRKWERCEVCDLTCVKTQLLEFNHEHRFIKSAKQLVRPKNILILQNSRLLWSLHTRTHTHILSQCRFVSLPTDDHSHLECVTCSCYWWSLMDWWRWQSIRHLFFFDMHTKAQGLLLSQVTQWTWVKTRICPNRSYAEMLFARCRFLLTCSRR